MHRLLELVIDVAATQRLTNIITDEEITRPAREWITATMPEGSRLTYLVNCPRCVSVWAGLAIGSGITPRWAKLALALSAGTLAAEWAKEVVSG